MNPIPEMIANCHCRIGENPLWHRMKKKVYWTDISAGRIFQYDPATGKFGVFFQGDPVGGFTIQADGSFLLFMEKGVVKTWINGELRPVFSGIPEERDTRFNDVIADPEGRVFCGTMPGENHLASLYRMDTDMRLRRVIENVTLSNGMGFSPDLRFFYHTDTRKMEIHRYDYDRPTGEISRRSVFVRVEETNAGHPDGLTVDAEGFVWSARWGGYCAVRYDPEGKEERRIRFPSKNVSSLTFGGENFTDIYVTTATGPDDTAPQAGALFRLNLGIRGLPEYFSRIRL